MKTSRNLMCEQMSLRIDGGRQSIIRSQLFFKRISSQTEYDQVPLHLLEENKDGYVDSHDDFADDETSNVRRKKLQRPDGDISYAGVL